MESIALSSNTLTLTAAAHPFEAGSTTVTIPEGMSIQQMLHEAQPDPVLAAYAVVFIDGHLIERQYWSRVYPKAGTLVEIRVLPMGGDTLRTVLQIAVLAIAGAVSGGTLFAGFAATLGANGSALLAAGISVVGNLAINALIPVKPPDKPRTPEETFSIQGLRNRARPFEPITQVLGRHRVAPDFGARTFTEIVGKDQYLRAIFVWGIGPLHIDVDSLRIGETPITEFEGVELEHRPGFADDAPRELYSDTVFEEALTIKLGAIEDGVDVVTGPQVRTTPSEADEIGIDITFPNGLIGIGRKSGDRFAFTAPVTVKYRAVGDTTWLTPTFTAKTFPDNWISGDTITFTGKREAVVRHGMRWKVPTKGFYEVQVERLPRNVGDGNNTNTTFWTALRAIENKDPITSRVPVATTTVRIKATDQLNGTLDEFNGIVTTIGKDWNGSSWVDDQLITNPASLYRHVLQGKANALPVADDRLDLGSLQAFHKFCSDNDFACGLVVQSGRSVWEVLLEVAACGRAAPANLDGGWGVTIDQPQAFPVSHITPRNSSGFVAEKALLELPHAFRIPFINEEQDWRQDERRVYFPGFDASNATRFEELRLPGITNPAQIEKFGRYRAAQGIHQPERFSFTQDMEFLTYKRGDRVKITHDVLLVGLHSGRVKSVVTDAGNNVTAIVVDEQIEMEAGKSYGISIRTLADPAITRRVITEAGSQTTLMLATSIPPVGGFPAVAKYDLFGFGLFGFETDDAQIISIMPNSNAEAAIVAVPYREEVYAAADEPITPFETNLTPIPTLPAPFVRAVVSDESVIVVGTGGALKIRVAFDVDPVPQMSAFAGAKLEVQERASSTFEPYVNSTIDEATGGRVIVSGAREGETIDYRLRWVTANLSQPGPWVTVANHNVVGRSTPPAPLTGLTLSAFGGMAYLRWDLPDELDVVFGGTVQFRHSPAMTGAVWGSSSTIGSLARASGQLAVLPLKRGTYLARVVDQSGKASLDTTSVTTKQATVLTFAAATVIDEAPSFSGTKTDVAVNSGDLELADPATSLTGVYKFSAALDFSSVVKKRLTSRIAFITFSRFDTIDGRAGLIDTWPDFDGDLPDGGDVLVEVRHTDDDPAGSPVWSEWSRLDAAEFEARAFEFRALISVVNSDVNVSVSELGIDADNL